MAKLGILFDERFRRHATGEGHPESPERLSVIHQAFEEAGILDECEHIDPIMVSDADMQRAHAHEYLTRLDAACRQCYPYIDAPDCAICPESYDIARLATGGVLQAARRVARGDFERAFCAVRPPGHHAEFDRAMGFCLLNNVAIAAKAVKEEFGFQRTLILDFDVHHCNGTQHCFELDPSVLVISLHGSPATLYPGTGEESETGSGPGRGYTMNIPFDPGATDDQYHYAFERRIIPAVNRYAPQMIFVSAGFDAHEDDPLGNLSLTDEIFTWMTERIVELAQRHTRNRLVSVLEGGYDPGVLQRCVPAHAEVLHR